MTLSSLLLFFILFTTTSAVFLIQNPVYGVLSFVMVVAQVVFVLILLDLEFLAYVLAIVYIGAIVVLFLFVIMMFYIYRSKTKRNFLRMCFEYYCLGSLASNIYYFSSFFVEFSYADLISTIFSQNLSAILSQILFNDALLLTCTAALTMLVGIVGAIMLTLKTTSFSRPYSIRARNLITEHITKKYN